MNDALFLYTPGRAYSPPSNNPNDFQMGGDESGTECTTRLVLLGSKPKASQLGPSHFPR